jgi:hypothetical protein
VSASAEIEAAFFQPKRLQMKQVEGLAQSQVGS